MLAAGVPEPVRVAVERLGGRVEVDGEGRLVLRFPRRGVSLVDLGLEVLSVLRGFGVVVLVEEGGGEGGFDYFYYVYRGELEALVSRLGGGSG